MSRKRFITERRYRRSADALAVLAFVSVLGAACSSTRSSGGIASLPSPGGSSATTSPNTQAQSDQDFVNYSRCLRSHGVNEPDPFHVAGHSGLSVEIPQRTAGTSAALDACNHFIEKDIQAKQAGGAELAAPRLAALTNYASCMRSRDIAMLDPDRYGDLSLGNVAGITNDFGRYSPQFRTADSACRHFLPAGVHDDGTGP